VAQIFSGAYDCVGLPVSITPHFCQVRVMKRLAVILLLTLLLPQLASAKRIPTVQVDPVVYEGIHYVAPNDDGRRGYIEAWNVGTNKKLWELTLFTNRIDPNLEEDVQRVFINALNIKDGRLMVTSEPGKTYQIDVNTKAITQLDSLSSRSPEAIRDVPDAVKTTLTNGSVGKEYDLSPRLNPSYPENGANDVRAPPAFVEGAVATTSNGWIPGRFTPKRVQPTPRVKPACHISAAMHFWLRRAKPPAH
jgi:hypothetical protein